MLLATSAESWHYVARCCQSSISFAIIAVTLQDPGLKVLTWRRRKSNCNSRSIERSSAINNVKLWTCLHDIHISWLIEATIIATCCSENSFNVVGWDLRQKFGFRHFRRLPKLKFSPSICISFTGSELFVPLRSFDQRPVYTTCTYGHWAVCTYLQARHTGQMVRHTDQMYRRFFTPIHACTSRPYIDLTKPSLAINRQRYWTCSVLQQSVGWSHYMSVCVSYLTTWDKNRSWTFPSYSLSVPGKVFAHVLLARLDPLLQKHRRVDLTNPDSAVVAPHWMQSWHCVCWRKSIENYNSRCTSRLWTWRRLSIP